MISILSACRKDSMKDKTDNFETVSLYDSTTTTVIPWDKDFYTMFDSLNHKPLTLTEKDFEQIDKAFDEIIEENRILRSEKHDTYKIEVTAKDYRKQLVAVTNSKGEKEVWVNCFCNKWDESWRTRLVTVVYDQHCCFNFKLNLTRYIVYDFRVNLELYR
jgi:hypothetical protein